MLYFKQIQDTWNHRFYLASDFIGNIGEFVSSSNGAGSSVSLTATSGDQNHVGICTLNIGTQAAPAGRAIISTQPNIMLLGGGYAFSAGLIQIPILPTATENFVVRANFIDNIANNSENTDGVYFRYQNGVNGDRIQAVCRNNNTETSADTGFTPTAGAWIFVFVEVNDAGTQAKFYINNVLVATITNNIPTGAGRQVGFGVYVQRIAGTTSRSVLVDFLAGAKNFTTLRW